MWRVPGKSAVEGLGVDHFKLKGPGSKVVLPVESVAFSPDGRFLAAIWRLGKSVRVAIWRTRPVSQVISNFIFIQYFPSIKCYELDEQDWRMVYHADAYHDWKLGIKWSADSNRIFLPTTVSFKSILINDETIIENEIFFYRG